MLGCLGMLCSMGVASAAEPLDTLKSANPGLYALYSNYQAYHEGLGDYAARQGFRRPYEHLATVVHELIHIDSAVHQGFYIEGTYYEPYLAAGAWPSLNNEQVRPYLTEPERSSNIYRLYVLNTPSNHLGNIVDEINAYSHVAPLVCVYERESAEKQSRNLTGFLHLVEGYLRTLRTRLPGEYQRLREHREARGALTLILERAWAALRVCGVREGVPGGEARYLTGR